MCRYRAQAAAAAARYPSYGFRAMFWPAIRDDVLAARSSGAMAALREALREHDDELVQRLGNVTDVRLLDMLAWQG